MSNIFPSKIPLSCTTISNIIIPISLLRRHKIAEITPTTTEKINDVLQYRTKITTIEKIIIPETIEGIFLVLNLGKDNLDKPTILKINHLILYKNLNIVKRRKIKDGHG